MGFLHLVKQDEAVRFFADPVCELALLAIANVAWRAADQFRHGVPLHEFAHVEAYQCIFFSVICAGERLAKFGLADASRPAEDEGGHRAVRILQSHTGTSHCLRHCVDGLVLANDPPVEGFLKLDEPAPFVHRHLLHGDPSPCGDYLRDVRTRHNGLLKVAKKNLLNVVHDRAGPCRRHCARRLALPLLEDALPDLRAQGGLLCLELRRAFEVLSFDGVLLLLLQLPEYDAPSLGVLRDRCALPQPHASTSLVQDVDGLVRQKPVIDILRGELCACDQGLVGICQSVVRLVFAREPSQNLNSFLDRRLVHSHRLESALQSLVLLHILPVLLDSCCADDLQLTACQRRLHDVGSVHRSATTAASPDKSVNFVDHQDDVAI
mmetsp:Transcript_12057/g.32557  ORF Transcript_12057/g.32557 Transcript_12057/m.32557 type:complete len:379 (+) Transcript_12057:745-1881(+)